MSTTLFAPRLKKKSISKRIRACRLFCGVLKILVVLVKEVGDQAMCDPCEALEKKIDGQTARKRRHSSTTAKDKAPLAACSAEKLRVTATRRRCNANSNSNPLMMQRAGKQDE